MEKEKVMAGARSVTSGDLDRMAEEGKRKVHEVSKEFGPIVTLTVAIGVLALVIKDVAKEGVPISIVRQLIAPLVEKFREAKETVKH